MDTERLLELQSEWEQGIGLEFQGEPWIQYRDRRACHEALARRRGFLIVDLIKNQPQISAAFKDGIKGEPMGYMKDIHIQKRNERQGRLDLMGEEGRLLEYLIETFKYRDRELACILMTGFDNLDHDNLKDYLDAEAGQQTQSEMDKEAGAWLDRQR